MSGTTYPWQQNLDAFKVGTDLPIDDDLLTEQNEELRSKLSDLKNQLSEAEIKIVEQRETIEELQKVSQLTFDKLNKLNDHLKTQFDQLSQQNEVLRQEVAGPHPGTR